MLLNETKIYFDFEFMTEPKSFLVLRYNKNKLNSCVAFWSISAKRLFSEYIFMYDQRIKNYPQGLPLI